MFIKKEREQKMELQRFEPRSPGTPAGALPIMLKSLPII